MCRAEWIQSVHLVLLSLFPCKSEPDNKLIRWLFSSASLCEWFRACASACVCVCVHMNFSSPLSILFIFFKSEFSIVEWWKMKVYLCFWYSVYANEVKKIRCEHHGCFNCVWILCLMSRVLIHCKCLYVSLKRGSVRTNISPCWISFSFAVCLILIQNEKIVVKLKIPAVKVCDCIFHS